MSDITLDLSGALAMMGLWVLAALFCANAVVLTVMSGVTGKKDVWGRRAIVSWLLAIAAFVSSYGVLRLGRKARETLDTAVPWWCIGVLAAGAFLCFIAGRRRSDASTDANGPR